MNKMNVTEVPNVEGSVGPILVNNTTTLSTPPEAQPEITPESLIIMIAQQHVIEKYGQGAWQAQNRKVRRLFDKVCRQIAKKTVKQFNAAALKEVE